MVLVKGYLLFIGLVWRQIADLPIAVLLVVLLFGALAIAGGLMIVERLVERFGWKRRRTWVAVGSFLFFFALAELVVMTALAKFAYAPFIPLAILGGYRLTGLWRNRAPTGRTKQLVFGGFVLLLLFLFDLKLFDMGSELRSLLRKFDAITFELRAAKTPNDSAGGLDPAAVSQMLIEHTLGYQASFHRIAAPIVVVRITRDHPYPVAGCLAIVDLTHPGIVILITPERGPKQLTSEFARRTGALIAINGEAGDSPSPGAPLREWTGNWIVRGRPIQLEDTDERPFMSFDARNHGRYFPARIVDREVTAEKYNTLWGRWDLLVGGAVASPPGGHFPRARTAMGLDATGTRLYLLQIDGDQTGYSAGLTFVDAGALLLAFGASDAMTCDEGGSSAMYIRDQGGIVGRPSDGEERPTYTHFGVGFSGETRSGGPAGSPVSPTG